MGTDIEKLYAKDLGITVRQLNRLGGLEKVQRMSNDARQVLVNATIRATELKRKTKYVFQP
jgi:hypothetical protein